MKKYFATFFALANFAFANAAPQTLTYESLPHEMGTFCRVNREAKCWKSFADEMAQLRPPGTERERQEQFGGYWMLANVALFVGDFPESKEFFDTTLKLVVNLKSDTKSGGDQAFAGMMVRLSAADLALSMRDYATALKYLDEYSTQANKSFGRDTIFDAVILQRCAALIGLSRNAEADVLLAELLQKLNFEGQSPWEGVPFGPQPLDPYQTARRIAAHYMREHNFEQALAVLKTAEEKRLKTISLVPKEPVRGQYWATMLDPADILDDKAAVYIAMGQDDQAEPLLMASLRERESTSNQQLKRTLSKLAALQMRAGQLAQARDFEARAGAIKLAERRPMTDPLVATLGFAE